MTIWTALILGLLIGWIVEWLIDWIYWRQRLQASTVELENLRVQNSRLRADLDASTGSLGKLKADFAALQIENERLRNELDSANGALGQYKIEFGTLNTNLSTAQADHDRLRAELDALHADRAGLRASLDTQGTDAQYKTQLLSIDPTLAASTGGVHMGGNGDEQNNGDYEQLATIRDPLIDIDGIGPVYEQRLFDAGIFTFAQLVAQTPERLHEIVGAQNWQEAETKDWIAEARQFIQAGRGRSTQ